MAAPETDARQELITAIAAEYAAEGFPVRDDHLHPSVGTKGTAIAVSTDDVPSDGGNRFINRINIKVQFYGKWKKEVDPEQTVSQATVEGYADRFRRMMLSLDQSRVGSDRVWYFILERIVYINDPTGNKTRFEAFVTARGNNTSLMETTA